MRTRIPRLVVSACLAVFILAGLLGVGYIVWDPEPPRDPNAVVLRIRFVGGVQGPRFLLRPVPDITVYGDGRVLVTRTVYDSARSRRLVMDGRLERDAYVDLYRDALLAGLGTSRTYRGDEQIMDGGSTRIEFLTDGHRRSTSLGQGAGGPRPWMINRLVHELHAIPAKPYRPDRLAILARRPDKTSYGDIGQAIKPWPLRPLADKDPMSCTIVTGAELRTAYRLLPVTGSETHTAEWRSGPHIYAVRFRPLLPDEKDCTAITN
jgi:hypothetical protein